MGDHLRVDLDLLDETARALKALRTQFADARMIARTNRPAIGAAELTATFDHFATNWKHHRDALVASIDAIEKLAAKAHDHYLAVDHNLAEELRNSSGPPSAAGGPAAGDRAQSLRGQPR